MENDHIQEYQKALQENIDSYSRLLKEEMQKNAELNNKLIIAQKEIIELKQKINSLDSQPKIIGRRPLG